MNPKNRWPLLFLMLLAAVFAAGCSNEASAEKVEPAIVEPVAGSEFNRVTLTERAAERLDIQTEEIREEEIEGKDKMVLPYSALLYGLHGETWVYTVDGDLTYVREPITVDYIEGDMVVLLDGPPAGTQIVTVGVAELFGTDTGVGK